MNADWNLGVLPVANKREKIEQGLGVLPVASKREKIEHAARVNATVVYVPWCDILLSSL